MTTTMLPPADDKPDTVPPDKSRDSTLPPADLGPMGIALRLLALEAQVGDIHLETIGISKAFHDIRNLILGLNDSYERIATSLEVLRHDAQSQRAEKARLQSDFNELERRVVSIEERKAHEVRNGKP